MHGTLHNNTNHAHIHTITRLALNVNGYYLKTARIQLAAAIRLQNGSASDHQTTTTFNDRFIFPSCVWQCLTPRKIIRGVVAAAAAAAAAPVRLVARIST